MSAHGTAFGHPGVDPHWSPADKDGVGTAYSASSRVWYTLRRGHLTEIYYPTIDMPQVRDVRILITDGQTFLDDEADHTDTDLERMCPSLGYHVRRRSAVRRYRLEKTVIADPHVPCVLQHIRVRGDADVLGRLKAYAVCRPHLGVGGRHNNAEVFVSSGRTVLVAENDGRWLAMGATSSFARASVGYDGQSDAVTDLGNGYTLDWTYAHASDGCVVIAGEIDPEDLPDFTLAVAFGQYRHSALTTLFQSLGTPFREQSARFCKQWKRAVTARLPLEGRTFDGGNLYRASFSLLLAHEDKTYPGAQIASLSIPWGEARGDDDGKGGYHLVWTRDLVQSATGLLAAGQTQTPLRTLIYLAVAQLPDGGFPQNFWLSGQSCFDGTQLDEVAFPVLLARRLFLEGACHSFDPADMVRRAARFLVVHGPITGQERWEEMSGYSPSTLAVVITACLCAAAFADEAGDGIGADFLGDYADWLRSHLAEWTVTDAGTLVDGVRRHFVRINPAKPGHPARAGDVDRAVVELSSQPPGGSGVFPARDIVDAGFLELVRHGIVAADDPLVIDSVRVVDQYFKVETPFGDAWRRYNHDGYGQRDGGLAYEGYGRGRPWPLLAGERGHYELAAGRDASPAIRALEAFGGKTGLIAEQVWDESDVPETNMKCGYPTGSARPLLWAHAEYLKLVRSGSDGVPYDRFADVAQRYRYSAPERPPEFWTFAHPTPHVSPDCTLRICAQIPFRLHFSDNNWKTASDEESSPAYGLHFVDLEIDDVQEQSVRFTMFWPQDQRWEGRDFEVTVG